MLNFFREAHVPVDALRREFDTSYVRDILGRFCVPIVSVREGLAMSAVGHVRMRHDVDMYMENAFALACLEHQLDITSSYYFLPPDGYFISTNYFGSIHNGRLIISKKFLEVAKQIQDMGHEIGIHNDLISMWIGTGIDPEDALAEILETMRSYGLKVSGVAGHGSQLCYKFKYLNKEIFLGLDGWHDDDILDVNGRKLKLRTIDKDKFGLSYAEVGHPMKFDINMHDSGNDLVMTVFSSRNLEKKEREQELRNRTQTIENRDLQDNIVARTLESYAHPPIVHCLIHGEHWTFQYAMGDANIEPCLEHMKAHLGESRKLAKRHVIDRFSNILHAVPELVEDKSNENNHYNMNVRRYVQETWLSYPVRAMAGRTTSPHILELGCGQGDFLNLVAEALPASGDRILAGMDRSWTAIADCAAKYPHIFWAVDLGEDFLDRLLNDADEVRRLPRQFGLILDKTGLVGIPDFDSAYAVLKKISRLLAPGGRYVYLASTEFYARWYADRSRWPLQWIDIARKVFDITEDLSDNPGAHAFAFGMNG